MTKSRFQLSRMPIAATAAICGIMALVGMAAATFAYVSTPEVRSVRSLVDGTIVEESKFIYLFSAPLFLILSFSIMTYYAIKWDEFAGTIAKAEQFYKEQFHSFRNVDFSKWYYVACIGWCALQGMPLFHAIYRSISVVNGTF
jgi:hypothetical protein